MIDPTTHTWLLWLLFGAAAATILAVIFISAPYGRHAREGWGPTLSSRAAWVLMETPPVLFFAWVYFQGAQRFELVPLVLLGIWQFHYVQRAYVFPFRMRSSGKRTPLLIPLIAIAFNVLNALVNAAWISHLGNYPESWLWDPRFLIGVCVFLVGWFINVQADTILINLRKPGETGYKVPRGGLYRFVSCPNYFGEILEWIGWAIATWSLAGLGFAIYTIANLAPRAFTHHAWYREKFSDYPKERKALVPFVM